MKNLLTLLLLVVSLLASGQSNNQSLEVEIQYWKSIAESNDTVAYREYLQRYGEDGLYKDEALTRITVLKSKKKQPQFHYKDCLFYISSKTNINKIEGSEDVFIVMLNEGEDEIWIRKQNYYWIRKNLSGSRNYYENDFINMKRRKSRLVWPMAEIKYDQMKSTSSRDVYFRQDTRSFKKWHEASNCVGCESYWEEKEFHGCRYYAFSKDKSSIITWFEDDDNLDGVIHEKMEYIMVPKEDFLPKAVNYDFLNE